MIKKIKFIVPGKPRPRKEPNISGKRFYSTNKAQYNKVAMHFKSQISPEAREELWRTEKDIFMGMIAVFSIPTILPKRLPQISRDDLKAGKLTMKRTRPDATNIFKGIEDALNGVAYKDDAVVHPLFQLRVYGDTPRTEVVLIVGNVQEVIDKPLIQLL